MGSLLNVKSIRLRLGWTQSDLARRLKCQVSEVSAWEQGRDTPAIQYASQLERLAAYADECAHELQSTPKAEKFCEKLALGQVPWDGIEDSGKS